MDDFFPFAIKLFKRIHFTVSLTLGRRDLKYIYLILLWTVVFPINMMVILLNETWKV